jgi:hypothetical protein
MARREQLGDNRSPDSGAAGELGLSLQELAKRAGATVSFKGISRDVVIYEAERA